MRLPVLLVALALAVPAQGMQAQARLPETDRALARDILRELVEIVTTDSAGNTPRAAQAMADRLLAAGFPAADVRVLLLNAHTGNLIARYRGRDAGLRPMVLMAHLDVVPALRADWTVDPYAFLERDGWFYGRGTNDDKGGAAAAVATFIRLKREGFFPDRDVILMLTGDEETSGESTAWLLTEHRALADAEFAVNLDAGGLNLRHERPLNFVIQVSEKMYADYTLEATDAGGHSSLPRPVNPIYTLAAALRRLGGYQFPLRLDADARLFLTRSAATESAELAGDLRAAAATPTDSAALRRVLTHPDYAARLRTTCVATRLEGGHANNALPQLARATVNCRLLPGTVPADVEATLRRLSGDSITLRVLNPPEASPPSSAAAPVFRTLDSLASAFWPGVPVLPEMSTGGTDGATLRRAGIPTYGAYGLADDVDDVRAHGRDERIGVTAFYEAVEFCYRALRALARRPGGI